MFQEAKLKMKIIKNTKEKMFGNKGFTLLETLVAIFILVLAITGPMVFAQSTLRAAFQSRDQITAFYLAQDVIEFIKNVRDTNGLKSQEWLSGLETCTASGGLDGSVSCSIDTRYGSVDIDSCGGNVCLSPLNEVSYAGGTFLGHGSGIPTRFKRTIWINEIESGREAEVIVQIDWESNVLSGSKRIVVQENIYAWIPTNN